MGEAGKHNAGPELGQRCAELDDNNELASNREWICDDCGREFRRNRVQWDRCRRWDSRDGICVGVRQHSDM